MKVIYFAVSNDLSMDQRMHRICTSLASNGWVVEIVGRRLKNSLPLPSGPYQSNRLKCLFTRGFLFYAELQIRILVYFLARKKPDLFGAVDTDTLPAMRILSILKRKPLLYDAHEIFDQVPELLDKPFVRRIWKSIEKICLPGAQYCWTVNQSLADYFEKEYGKKFTVIRNLPMKQVTGIRRERQKGLILYQGKVNKGRGIEQMLHAMKFLPACQLVVAGGGDLLDAMKKMADDLALANVKFTGPQSPDQLRHWTSLAWLGLNLLEKESGNYYYSLANKFFDYMSFGVPSLSMNFPEYRRINDQYGFSLLLQELQPEKIAEAIQRLLDDERLYEKLSTNALNAAGELNWQEEEKKIFADLARVR